ncbi:molybdenum cofactor guanylyltransferase [Desulfonema magnum]|uniref:Probable molybdenum cofactor guanylyltransferase n=1 Tax=Desulfonema magnum TaxID=45655 RepID=A0A975GNS5_9BACT|nr:molybdenum cofactor guanylyltransferase [Desulfonema magnum]QTA87163.1 Molbdopterin-guanine dinucleotide biosynthesis protein A [Desulfonema magnum]
MKFPCSGVILAGGLNTRFSGINKAFVRVGGMRIFDRIYSVFNDLFEETILVTNDPLQYLDWDITITTDIFPIRSSLTGIHAGLLCATNPYVFFIACDTPFLKKEMVETLIDEIEPRFDVVIPETSAGYQALCAVYSKNCINPVEQHLVQKKLKIQGFFKKVRVKKVPENILREHDPELISFFNVNTPDELAKAEKIIEQTCEISKISQAS